MYQYTDMLSFDINRFIDARKVVMKKLNSKEYRHEYKKMCYVKGQEVERRGACAELVKDFTAEMLINFKEIQLKKLMVALIKRDFSKQPENKDDPLLRLPPNLKIEILKYETH